MVSSASLDTSTVEVWRTILEGSLPEAEKITLLQYAKCTGSGPVAFVVTNQRVATYPLSTRAGMRAGVPRTSPKFDFSRSQLRSVVEISPRKYSFNGIHVTFNRESHAKAAATKSATLSGVAVQTLKASQAAAGRGHVNASQDAVQADNAVDRPNVHTVRAVDSRRRRSDVKMNKITKHVGIPLFILGALAVVVPLGYAFTSWVGGLDDDDQTGPSDADTYAYDVTYTPPALGAYATGEARFIDDVSGLGIQPAGSTTFEDLSSAICNDLATSTNDEIVVEQTADAIGSTLEKAHYIVLSAQYNVC